MKPNATNIKKESQKDSWLLSFKDSIREFGDI
jgi:hypothetical protein